MLVTLDDDLDTLLSKYPNQNEVTRTALRLYIGDITPDTVDGLRKSYNIFVKLAKDMDSKLDYIAGRLQ